VTDSTRHPAVCLTRLSGTSANCGSHRAIFLYTLDLRALYPNSGSASTLERESYKRNGLGKGAKTLTRHRGCALSKITIPQLVSFQSHAAARTLGLSLGCRYAVRPSVEERHIRHRNCRYGVFGLRCGSPQVLGRATSAEGSRGLEGCPLRQPSCRRGVGAYSRQALGSSAAVGAGRGLRPNRLRPAQVSRGGQTLRSGAALVTGGWDLDRGGAEPLRGRADLNRGGMEPHRSG
jgi:hypothetical protein